jgi:protocatechuate 3,4-dioxygenase beta subunit
MLAGMKFVRPNRRQMLELCITRGLLVGGALASQKQLLADWVAAEEAALKPTSAEVLGPFFRKGAPNRPVLRAAGAPGFPLQVVGRVVNTKGQLVEGATVDLWHADHAGRYDTKGYEYRAKLTPDAKGEYSVATIMPGHYVDRPAQHIHYLIAAPGHKSLITQAYFATDPFFEGDPAKNWNKRGIAANKELVLPVKLFEGPENPRAEVRFDIVLEKA